MRKRLQEQIIGLASQAKAENFTFKNQEEIFNRQWQKWLAEITQSTPQVTYTTHDKVEVEIYNVLLEQYNAHGQLVIHKVQAHSLPAHGQLSLEIDRYSHLDSTRWLSNITKHAKKVGSKFGVSESATYAEVTEEDVCFAKNQTNDIFN